LKEEKNKVLSLIERVHNSRVTYNKDDIGFGFDIYCQKLKFHYDEAYALWGLGYLNLYSLEDNIFDVSIFDHIVRYFLNNKRYDGSFGLPWDWQGQRKEEGYLITTSFVALFLQKYNSIFNDNRVNALLTKIEDYMFSLQENRNGHIYLRYSKHMNDDVLNAYAVAMLFLIINDYYENRRLVEQLLDSIQEGQDKTGGFLYMINPTRKVDIPDNYHQCFIINSLIGIRDFLLKHKLFDQKLNEIIDKGITYFINNFFDKDLYLRRHAKEPLIGKNSFHYRKAMLLRTIAKLKRKLLCQPPSRSRPNFYDYGQTLALLSSDLYRYSMFLPSVIDQSESDLNFIKEDNFYIKDMGHFFYGLIEVLTKLNKWENI